MKNQEIIQILEEAKSQYEKYEQYRTLQTAQVLGLESECSIVDSLTNDLNLMDNKTYASMGRTSTTVLFYK